MPTVDPRETLLASIRVQTATDRRVLALLRQATRDVNRQLDGILRSVNVGDVVRREQMLLARAALLERTLTLTRQIGDVIHAQKIQAAIEADRAMLDYDAVLLNAYAGNRKIAAYLRKSAVTMSQESVALAERRLFGKGYIPLSEQVYRTGVVSSGLIDSAINSALARGLNAREFAKEVSGLINPDVPGGVSYASMRLARNEIARAFHARSIDNEREKPWVDGMQWHLSGSHPRPDECNDYADDVHFRGGDPGVYKIDDVPPRPHINCLCFVTPVETDEDTFLSNLLSGNYDAYIDREIAVRRTSAAQDSAGKASFPWSE